MSSKNKYDGELFKIYNDKQLSEIYKVSKQAIALIRKNHFSDTDSLKNTYLMKSKIIDGKILEFIRLNPNDIVISQFLKINSICSSGKRKNDNNHLINSTRFLRVASENGINITFACVKHSENEHGMHCIESCKCELGKFANNIKSKSRRIGKKYQGLPFKIMDEFAAKYLSEYQKIKPPLNTRALLSSLYTKIFMEIDEIWTTSPENMKLTQTRFRVKNPGADIAQIADDFSINFPLML